MTAFTLDTSGEFLFMSHDPLFAAFGTNVFAWSDLTPFEQGYVEAMLNAGVEHDCDGRLYPELDGIAFSDLAPETLSAIRKDCANFQNYVGGLTRQTLGAREGARLWVQRNDGSLSTGVWGAAFPPLTVSLGDDGKVYARAAT